MFKFNGISSDDMKIIIEEEEHFLAKASQRYEVIEIEGKDGYNYNNFGYSNIERPIKVQILDNSKLDAIFAWLNGPGILEYNNRITTAYFFEIISPIRNSIIKIADFNFIRDPFWYKNNDTYEVVTTEVLNNGNIYSKPIIRLEKNVSDKVDITISGIRFIYNFDDKSYVEIDCESNNATSDGILKNRQLEIGYVFPKLSPGKNTIIINSGDPTIKIKRKDRWL